MNNHSTVLVILIDRANEQIEQCLLQLVQDHLAKAQDITVIHANDLEKASVFSTRRDQDALRMAFYEGLSKRQQDVTRLAVRGQSNEEVADKLGVVSGVVAARLTEIYGMLDALRSSGMDVRANRPGLIAFFGDFFALHPELA